MNIKKIKIIGIIVAFILCFFLHFLYDKFPNFLTSIFAPVNESIWEHTKILFGSILLSAIVQNIIIKFKNIEVNNFWFSNFIGAILSIPIFLVLFLPIYYTIGENFLVAITIMIITIIISEIISYIITNKNDLRLEKLSFIFIIIVYIIFGIFTYFPLKNDLFIDPRTSLYGINKTTTSD